ncbi:MAG: ABC transporter permease [Candidatus Izemoplasmatales bacterium]
MKKAGLTILSVFIIFLIWLMFDLIIDNSLLLPNFYEVIKAMSQIFSERTSLIAILSSLLRLLIGLFIAFIFGFSFGILSGLNKNFETIINPIVTILRTIPVISITVIILIVAGFSLTPYIITFLMIFPLIYQGIYGAIKGIDQELIDVYKLEDNQLFSRIIHCYIPLISDDIKTSLLQSLGLGIKVLVMAEYLAQTKNSIGNMLYLAKTNIEYAEVFAWSIILVIVALIFETIINHYKKLKIQKKVIKNNI